MARCVIQTEPFTLDDEEHALEVMRQDVAKAKLAIINSQAKRSIALAEMEIEAGDAYRLMKEQEHKVDRIKEFIRIAKISGNKF